MAPRNRPAASTEHDVEALAAELGHPLHEVSSVYDGPTGAVVSTTDGNAYTKVDDVWHIVDPVDGFSGPMPVLRSEPDGGLVVDQGDDEAE